MLKFINKSLFIFFHLIRAAKNLSLDPLKEINFRFDVHQHHNYKRSSNPSNGYESYIRSEFIRLFQTEFKEMQNSSLLNRLFPETDSYSSDFDKHVHADIAQLIERNVSKYRKDQVMRES